MEKTVRTPAYWTDKKVFGELTEVETAYGHKVMIPKRFTEGWEMSRLRRQSMIKCGLDPLDGLENIEEVDPLYYDLERVFLEIYED